VTTYFSRDPDGPPFDFTALTQENRGDLVNLSANISVAAPLTYISATTLDLSALGATTDLLGQWNPTPGVALAGWHHIASTGRDVFVKVLTRGWLFPTGHAASSIVITEREVDTDPNTSNYSDAYLGQNTYVRVTEPTKAYPAVGQPFGTNDWPFQSLTITTSVSPPLALTPLATTGSSPPPGNQANLLASAGSNPFLWSVVAIDVAGNELHLRIPLLFVHGMISGSSMYADEFDESVTAYWVNAYNNLVTTDRSVSGHGQVLQLAPPAAAPSAGSDTTHPVVSLTLGAATPSIDPNTPTKTPPSVASESTLVGAAQPAFYPVLSGASIRLPAADALSGNPNGFTDSSGLGVAISFFENYVANIPPLNGLYAQLSEAATSLASEASTLLQFPSNLVGGLGTPNMLMSGLSSIAGPVSGLVSGLEDFTGGTLDPESYFTALTNQLGSALPQLFGSLSLSDILDSFLDDLLGGIPNLTTMTDPDTGAITVTYKLSATLQAWNQATGEIIFFPGDENMNPDDDSMFNLTATAVVPLSGTPTYDVAGSITPFWIYLVGDGDSSFIQIWFQNFAFTSKSGSKTKVDVSVGTVNFAGALSFVNTLEDFLQDLGNSGLSINVTPTQVDASMSLSLPDVAVGVFSLSGISFSSGLTIPFLGNPALLTFGFATQDNPFVLTVCMFGGGGFLSLGLGFAGVQTVQASFEFAGQFALDIGVASGGVTVAAGVYYSYSVADGTTLTGFVRITGEVEVLGIISISAELDLSLTYVSDNGTNSVQGTATLKVSISICFFSVTVPLTVTKQFSGGSSSPSGSARNGVAQLQPDITTVKPITFEQMVPSLSDWRSYCKAFAS
jgi:hypothetical protein